METRSKIKVIIIGCGASGATAAQRFLSLGHDVTILEREKSPGGKLKSVMDGQDVGAVTFTPIDPAIDTIVKENLSVVPMSSGHGPSDRILYGNSRPSLIEKLYVDGKLSWQMGQFFFDFFKYNYTYDQSNIPSEYLLDLNSYFDHHHMHELAQFMKLWMSHMGHGPLSSNYVYRVFNNMGHIRLFNLCYGKKLFGNDLYSFSEGHQQLVLSMVKNMDVRTNIEIETIERDKDKIRVTYFERDKYLILNPHQVEGDLLVLTMSPYHWHTLGMQLNDIEKECVNKLCCTRYPVAVCDIKNYPYEQMFIPSAMEGPSLKCIMSITTKDKILRVDGTRRVVIHMGLITSNQEDFSLDVGHDGRKMLLNDLEMLGHHHHDVTIRETKIWKDYNPTLPLEVSKKLENMQGQNNTLYLGAYSYLSFESVAAVQDYAKNTIDRFFCAQRSTLSHYTTHLYRAYSFFKLRQTQQEKKEPITNQEKPEKKYKLN